MKKYFILCLIIVLFNKISKGQDVMKRFEFGSTLIAWNEVSFSHYTIQVKPTLEFCDGLFFRYTKNRIGIRAQVSYFKNYSAFSQNMDVNTKDFRIGLGAQYTLTKKTDCLYTFMDLSYRNVISAGHSLSSEGPITFSSNLNGVNAGLGIGFKMKVVKNVYLSPEVGYNVFVSHPNNSSTSLVTGQTIKSGGGEITVSPVARMHLTVKF